MATFHQIFRIHPVGQGLFYSGRVDIHLQNRHEVFRFVYDCGSLTKDAGEEEVDRYRRDDFTQETDRIDLLVISHFDADHVNHIKRLLAEKRKVDNLVMPFMDFAERFFLTLRFLENKNAGPSGDDFGTIRLILDPLGELADNLGGDDGGTVYLITSDPDTPAGGAENEGSANDFIPDTPATAFGFKGLDKDATSSELQYFNLASAIKPGTISKVRAVKDSVTGDIHYKSADFVRLMEFVFYKREASGDEKAFYRAVFDAFCSKFNIKSTDIDIIQKLTDALRTIRGATDVRKYYAAAKKNYSDVKIKYRDILNMNSTALCMLHRNLPSVFSIFGGEDRIHYCYHYSERFIQKIGFLVSVDLNRGWQSFKYSFLRNQFFYKNRLLVERILPNVLLTSDAYLKKTEEVDAFFRKYEYYRDKYAIVQVPHHGSKNNSDHNLFARVPQYVSKFINYGTRHKFDKKFLHPDKEVISSLIAAGHGHDILAVTEHAGYSLYFEVGMND